MNIAEKSHRPVPQGAVFQQLHHVCIVVHDLARAVAEYERLGMGPWFDYPKGSPYVEFEVPNEAASKAMAYKCCDLGNVQIQLCQPPAMECPQRAFLDAHGEGVYHLGFEVASPAAAERALGEAGVATIARGRRADGSGFAYFDTRADAGVTLEVRRTPAP